MRILIYGFSGVKGGKEEYILNLNKISVKYNIFFDYFVNDSKTVYEKEIRALNGRIYYCSGKSIVRKTFSFRKTFLEVKKDIIAVYFNTSGLYYIYPLFLAKFYNIKIIVHAHSAREPKLNFLLQMLNKINQLYVNKNADLKLQCSDLAGRWIFGTQNDVIQINNGIDLKKFKFNPQIRNSYRNELNICDNEVVLLNVGRMQFPKNQQFLIDLMRYLPSKFRLILVGDGQDYNKLKEYTKLLNLDTVNFLGNRDDVNKIMQASDLFLMPSFFEGFPISAIEAQAAGLKCILSDCITSQAKITDLVTFIDIKFPEFWLDEISHNNKYIRQDRTGELKVKGFDVHNSLHNVVQLIQNLGDDKK